MNEISDTALIDRILGGDISGFSVLIDRYKDLAFTLAYRIVGNREDAEEVLQDAFLNVYKGLDRFRRKARFSTWLYRIVYNKAVSRKRLKKVPVTSLEESTFVQHTMEDYGSEDALDHEERTWQLEKALGSLAEEDRTIITLYYLHESSVEEIRAVTGLSRSNVKVRLFRARKKLQALLDRNSGLVFV